MVASSLAEFIPQNQFVPEIVSPLPSSPAIVRHTVLIVYFFKELISFIGSLDKCHTSVFNALIDSLTMHSSDNTESTKKNLQDKANNFFFMLQGTINAFQNNPWFLCVCSTSLFKKQCGKSKKQFLLFPQCFLSI